MYMYMYMYENTLGLPYICVGDGQVELQSLSSIEQLRQNNRSLELT